MADFRRRARKAVYDSLVHVTNGLNQKLLAAAGGYGISPAPSVNFANSKQFLQGFLATEGVDMSVLSERPALVLFTSTAASQDGREKYRKFAGDVTVNLHFYLEYQNGAEQGDVERYADLFEDALIECLASNAQAMNAAGAYWDGDYLSERDLIVQLGDGWGQRILTQMIFEVTV